MQVEKENLVSETESPLPRKPHSQPLAVLNHQSETRTFSLDDLDWKAKLDFNLNWIPEAFVSASYLPSYQHLTPEQSRRYNQLSALAVCEQFVWFEEDLLCRVLRNVLRSRDLAPDLRTCLQHFVAEEERHSDMFTRLLRKADPDFYSTGKYQFFGLSGPQTKFFDTVTKRPNLLLVWIWMAIYFEERTLHISRLYRREEKRAGDPTLDATFARAHFLHMIDESRHLQIDQYLLENFFETEPTWKRQLGAFLTTKVFEAYRSPKRIARRILTKMKQEDPIGTPIFDKLIEELPLLATNQNFKEVMFGKEALGRTRELLEIYSEMRAAYRSLTT
jgi:hypothetical protein